MILTDKAKKDFLEWLELDNNRLCGLDLFQLNNNFINTLIIEWLDSVGIYINVSPYVYNDRGLEEKVYFKNSIINNENIDEQNTYLKRIFAINQAIIRANEIYNSL